jgi:hypothetical protein
MPCGAAGATVVAAWLVESRKGVVGNVAPVLATVFTPLTTVLLTAFLVAIVAEGGAFDAGREILILFDVVLVLVLGLLLYSLSARDPNAAPAAGDWVTLALLVLALAVDVVMLVAMADRIATYGASPNKAVALVLNLILLVNLAWAARLTWPFVRGRSGLAPVVAWQMGFLPVFPAWAAIVIVVVPPVFGFG